MKKMKKYKADIILVSVIAGAGLLLILFLLLATGSGKYAEIRIDGEVTDRLSLLQDTVKSIDNEYGKNTIVIENGEAYIKDADCPDGLCMNMGRISRTGQSVICLPHKLVVEITDGSGNQNKDDVDIIVK